MDVQELDVVYELPRTVNQLAKLGEEHDWYVDFAHGGMETDSGRYEESFALRFQKGGLTLAALWRNGSFDGGVSKTPLIKFSSNQLKEYLRGDDVPRSAGNVDLEDDVSQNIRWEREYLEAYLTGYPLDLTGVDLRESTDSTSSVRDAHEGRKVSIVGLVLDVESTKTRNGNPWARFTVEDLSGRCAAFAFGKIAEGAASGILARLEGTVVLRDEERQLKVTKAELLEEW